MGRLSEAVLAQVCSPRLPTPTLNDTKDLQGICRGRSLTVPVGSLFDESSVAESLSNSLPDSASHGRTASDIDQSQMAKTVRNMRFRGFSHTLPVASRGSLTGYPLPASASRPRSSSVSNKLARVPRADSFCTVPHQERTNSFNAIAPVRRSIEGISNESQFSGFDRMRLTGIASSPSPVQASVQARMLQVPTMPQTNLSATGQPLKTSLQCSDMQIHRTMAPWPMNSPWLAGITEEPPPQVQQTGLIGSHTPNGS